MLNVWIGEKIFEETIPLVVLKKQGLSHLYIAEQCEHYLILVPFIMYISDKPFV
jgi:hypothetical protein